MPNWCDGNIRVRGTYDKIVKFFADNLIALKIGKEKDFAYRDLPVKVVRDGDFFTRIEKPEDGCEEEFWFKDSQRQFLKTDIVELADWSDEDYQEIIICVEGFHGAWGIDHEYFKLVAEKSQVDVKIFGYERGMEFVEIAEFHRDGQEIAKVERYNDWMWECARPNLGG